MQNNCWDCKMTYYNRIITTMLPICILTMMLILIVNNTKRWPEPAPQTEVNLVATNGPVTVLQKRLAGIDKSYMDLEEELRSSEGNAGSRNEYPFQYILNKEDKCQSGGTLKLVMIVPSAVPNFQARMTIRHTWGTITLRKDVRLVFFLAATGNSTQQELVEAEDELYGDIVQEDFVDSYRNLSLKTIALLRWTKSFCKNAEFLAKADDDTFINVPYLLEFLETRNATKRVIYGKLVERMEPFRDPTSKYYVSKEDFPGNEFPTYTQGHLYVVSMDSVQDLLDTATSRKVVPNEDVFVTGICAERANISRIHDIQFLGAVDKTKPCTFRKIISIVNIEPLSIYDIWNYVNNPHYKSCDTAHTKR